MYGFDSVRVGWIQVGFVQDCAGSSANSAVLGGERPRFADVYYGGRPWLGQGEFSVRSQIVQDCAGWARSSANAASLRALAFNLSAAS